MNKFARSSEKNCKLYNITYTQRPSELHQRHKVGTQHQTVLFPPTVYKARIVKQRLLAAFFENLKTFTITIIYVTIISQYNSTVRVVSLSFQQQCSALQHLETLETCTKTLHQNTVYIFALIDQSKLNVIFYETTTTTTATTIKSILIINFL